MRRVLIAGFKKSEQSAVEKIFSSVQVPCETVESIETAIERIGNEAPALVMAKETESVNTIQSLDMTLKLKSPTTPIIVTLNNKNMEKALDFMKAGAFDCLTVPLTRFDVLVTAKRATKTKGLSLFVEKVTPPNNRSVKLISAVIGLLLLCAGVVNYLQGPPQNILLLDSKYLTGLQWEGRYLWVGDWFNGTVTKFKLGIGLARKWRKLETDSLFRMKDAQPILVCHTPRSLITVGTDLKMRSHKWEVGLPTLQIVPTEGSNPTGLAWDGQSLWSVDGESNLLYRYDAFFRIMESQKSVISNPVGLAWGEDGFWVVGANPLQVAKMERIKNGYVWRGPYVISDWIPKNKKPTGLSVGFKRLWLIFEGETYMVSKSLSEIQKNPVPWKVESIDKEEKKKRTSWN